MNDAKTKIDPWAEIERLKGFESQIENLLAITGHPNLTAVVHELFDLRNEREWTKDGMYVPGSWACPICNYHLQSNILYARTGQIGANTQEPEPCPNDGVTLRPVTWREAADDAHEYIKTLHDERERLRAVAETSDRRLRLLESTTSEEEDFEACLAWEEAVRAHRRAMNP